MALQVLKGGVMTSSKNIKICINILSLCIHQQKTRTPNTEYLFFIANYMTSRVFREFERLSSSFWRRVMVSYSQRWNSPQISVFGSKILSIFCFWAIILDPDMPASQSRAPKTRFQVKKTLSEKFALVWSLGPGKVGLKCPKHALIVT